MSRRRIDPRLGRRDLLIVGKLLLDRFEAFAPPQQLEINFL